MTPENFIYWLQGKLELSDPSEGLSPGQVQIIKDHICLVLHKVTPTRFVASDQSHIHSDGITCNLPFTYNLPHNDGVKLSNIVYSDNPPVVYSDNPPASC
jgi:hypothetical protein